MTKRYALEVTASEGRHELIEVALLDVLDAVVKLGVSLAGTQANIVTTPVQNSPLTGLPPEVAQIMKIFGGQMQ